MHPFELTASIVGPIVGGIIVLSLFYKLSGWVSRYSKSGAVHIGFRGLFDEETRAIVQLRDGRSFKDVRFIGVTDPNSFKEPFPYELREMVILEKPDGGRVLVRARMIRWIEVGPSEA
jgi:hypothetical protein